MKIYQIGLIFALVFGLAVVTAAKTLPQSLPTQPSQQSPVVPFSEEELLNASPFDAPVQKRTFYAVAKIMHIKRFDPKLAMPAVVVNTTIPVEKIAEYIGFDLGSNQIHYFGYLKNTILLSENAKVHNLAHEMVHYFQFYYQLKGDPKNLLTDPEPVAVRIQHFFRADPSSLTARFSN